MKKRAQIQIGETIAVLLVFFILIFIGFVFYAKVIRSNVEQENEESSQLRSIGIAQRVMFLPEVQCSMENIITDSCVDILKLDAAERVMNESSFYYYDLLEFSEVNITLVYPLASGTAKSRWTIYSRKGESFKNSFITNVPVSLFNPVTRTNNFGILTIETMSR